MHTSEFLCEFFIIFFAGLKISIEKSVMLEILGLFIAHNKYCIKLKCCPDYRNVLLLSQRLNFQNIAPSALTEKSWLKQVLTNGCKLKKDRFR